MIAVGLMALSYGNDNDAAPIVPGAGMISGGPFSFCVDGEADFVSGIWLNNTDAMGSNSTWIITDDAGSNSTWVITDDAGKVLGLPPTLADIDGIDFGPAGSGTCLIWYLRYEEGLQGAAVKYECQRFDWLF